MRAAMSDSAPHATHGMGISLGGSPRTPWRTYYPDVGVRAGGAGGGGSRGGSRGRPATTAARGASSAAMYDLGESGSAGVGTNGEAEAFVKLPRLVPPRSSPRMVLALQ